MPIAKIDGGLYTIGSANIPNASPSHQRRLSPFWVDRFPVNFAHLERFISSGGYHDQSLWTDSDRGGASFLPNDSVDGRCVELWQSSRASFELQSGDVARSSEDLILVGLSWNEAAAICRFFGARLPFEAEWETAMQPASAPRREPDSQTWAGRSLSRWGCVLFDGVLQEWTADPFSPRYWRADSDRHGTFWTASSSLGVTIRGSCRSDMHQDYRFRRSADPREPSPRRGFRRVWTTSPDARQISASFPQVDR